MPTLSSLLPTLRPGQRLWVSVDAMLWTHWDLLEWLSDGDRHYIKTTVLEVDQNDPEIPLCVGIATVPRQWIWAEADVRQVDDEQTDEREETEGS